MAWPFQGRTGAGPDSGPEAAAGSPTYDASIDPGGAGVESMGAERARIQSGIVLFGHKGAAAEVYSHVYDSQPSDAAVQIMGLAADRDLIQAQVDRKLDLPFPGVVMSPQPSFSRAPDTSPVAQPFDHFRHHAHQIESKSASRARFGR
jgi:hypothetical protein